MSGRVLVLEFSRKTRLEMGHRQVLADGRAFLLDYRSRRAKVGDKHTRHVARVAQRLGALLPHEL